jgi:Ino eighty subunit 1
MKTALRTYHPVPSLQKSDGNAQDAPRIKNCLKAALLPSELKGVAPSTPEEVLEKQVINSIADIQYADSNTVLILHQKLGQCPPTSVVNLIFVLANHAAVRSSHIFVPTSIVNDPVATC